MTFAAFCPKLAAPIHRTHPIPKGVAGAYTSEDGDGILTDLKPTRGTLRSELSKFKACVSPLILGYISPIPKS